jgi:hypothetical protein
MWKTRIALLVMMLLAFSLVTSAQDGETVTYEGFEVTLPDGWLSQDIGDGGLAMYSSSAAEVAIDGESLPDGEIFMLMQPPGVGFNEDTEGVLFEDWAPLVFESEEGVTSYDALDNPAQYINIGEELIPSNASLIMVDYDGTEVLFVVVAAADYADIEGQVIPILNSVTASGETLDLVRQWATSAEATSQYGDDSWSATQATGAPDTDQCGDIPSAWASASATGEDVILLEYDEAVVPTEVNIYQTYNPGAITRVELALSTEDATYVIEDSDDPPGNTDCPGVFTVDSSMIDTPVDTVIIYLNQEITGDWNEIDAVELVGIDPATLEDADVTGQWATGAEATSQYGDDSWSAQQATGAPDTDQCGDVPTAWASASSTGEDVLLLTYDTPVMPTEVNIHQTYNPGAIIRVELALSTEDATYVLDDSADPPGNTDCPGVFTVDATGVDSMVDTVIIYLDQTITQDWNEIDAVELRGIPQE